MNGLNSWVERMVKMFKDAGMEMCFPKLFNLTKYPEDIREFGMLDFSDTGPKEHFNKLLRAAYGGTNKQTGSGSLTSQAWFHSCSCSLCLFLHSCMTSMPFMLQIIMRHQVMQSARIQRMNNRQSCKPKALGSGGAVRFAI
jgi:hypothetical protein